MFFWKSFFFIIIILLQEPLAKEAALKPQKKKSQNEAILTKSKAALSPQGMATQCTLHVGTAVVFSFIRSGIGIFEIFFKVGAGLPLLAALTDSP